MRVVSISAFSVALFLILEAVIRKSDFFSPGRIYFFFHSFALGIAFLRFNPAMTPFKLLTSLVYFGSAICFLLGLFVSKLLALRSQANNPNDSKSHFLNLHQYNWGMHFIFSLALFTFFIWGTLSLYLHTGAPLLAKDKIQTLRIFLHQRWILLYAYTYGGIVMALFSIYIFRPSRHSFYFNVGLWMTTITLIIFSLALQRSALMFFIVFFIVFYNYGIRRVSVLNLFCIFMLCGSAVLITGFFKTSSIKNALGNKYSKTASIVLKVPYMYIANNFWNLDFALNPDNFQERHPTTYGYTILQGILDGLYLPGGVLGYQLIENTGVDDQFNAQASKIRGWNTIGYQWSWYKDFGIAGVFVGPFLIGLFINILYLRMRARITFLNLTAYSCLAYWMANSYFGSIFETPAYFYGLIYLCICCYFCQSILPKSQSFALKT